MLAFFMNRPEMRLRRGIVTVSVRRQWKRVKANGYRNSPNPEDQGLYAQFFKQKTFTRQFITRVGHCICGELTIISQR